MVLLEVTHSYNQFVVQAAVTDSVEAVTKLVTDISNCVTELKLLTADIKQQLKSNTTPSDADTRVQTTISEVTSYLSDEQVKRRIPITLDQLQQYKSQLSEHCSHPPTPPTTNDNDYKVNALLDAASSILWFVSKPLERQYTLEKYVGRNEKVYMKFKLTGPTQHAPSNSTAVDADTRKAMMQYYHKKTSEQKALENDSEQSYNDSEWANPNALKQSITGIGGGLKFR